MGAASFSFQVHVTESHCAARRGAISLSRGTVETPAFMPVGTQGTVKGLTVDMIRATGAQMVLGNTYHLALRPGAEVVEAHGGLQAFMGWDGPILTDSGGFQVFSLAQMTKVSEEAVEFRSHIDGRLFELSPERAIQIQEQLGSDIAMVLDHVVALPNDLETIRDASERSIRWAERCQDAASGQVDQVQFAIVQGGLDHELRRQCATELAKLDFAGYAIGGLSVGEEPADMYRILAVTCPVLPETSPRYLMGVGRPEDILEAVRQGVDLFDCVMPTRNGRNALAFTDQGPLRLRNKRHALDRRPLQEGCCCLACRHSRGYLRHLFLAKEMLGPILVSIHNLTYYQKMLSEARAAIEEDCFLSFFDRKMEGWQASREADAE